MAVIIRPPGGIVKVSAPKRFVETTSTANSVVITPDHSTVTTVQRQYNVDIETGVIVGGNPYKGSYEADALFSEQVFPTALKTMADDFTVHAINYTEAPNDSGITLTIGG